MTRTKNNRQGGVVEWLVCVSLLILITLGFVLVLLIWCERIWVNSIAYSGALCGLEQENDRSCSVWRKRWLNRHLVFHKIHHVEVRGGEEWSSCRLTLTGQRAFQIKHLIRLNDLKINPGRHS